MVSNATMIKVVIELNVIRTTPCLLNSVVVFANEYTRF